MSRRSSRSDKRDGTTGSGRMRGGRDYEYYDGQQQDDDSWSPDEYFSPEGVKGRWASDQGGRRGPAAGSGRGDRFEYDGGQVDDGYGQYGADGYAQDGYEPGGYGEEYGGYTDFDDRADAAAADDAPAPRGGRRRRAGKGERGLRRLVRRSERDPDIWPDDGVSDEDYWASVAADKPLPAADPEDSTQVMPARSAAGASRGTGSGRLGPAPLSAPAADVDADKDAPPQRPAGRSRARRTPGIPAASSEQAGTRSRPRFGDDSFEDPSARRALGEDASGSGTFDRADAGGSGAGSGARPDASARPAAGIAQPLAQPSSQPQPTVAQPSLARGLPRPGSGQAAQPRFQPSFQPKAPPGGSRQPDAQGGRADAAGRGGYGGRADYSGYGSRGGYGTGQDQNGRMGAARMDAAERTQHVDRGGQPADPLGYGAQPTASRPAFSANRGADDDPLTSTAYSREALAAADGRSYRAAASRRGRQAADPYAASGEYGASSSEATQTFTRGGSGSAYGGNGQHPAGAQYAAQASQPSFQPPAASTGTAAPQRAALPAAGSPGTADNASQAGGRAASGNSHLYTSQPSSDWPTAAGAATAASGQGSAEYQHAVPSRGRHANRADSTGYDAAPSGYGGNGYGGSPYGGSSYGGSSYGESPYSGAQQNAASYDSSPYGGSYSGASYGGSYSGASYSGAAYSGTSQGGTDYYGGTSQSLSPYNGAQQNTAYNGAAYNGAQQGTPYGGGSYDGSTGTGYSSGAGYGGPDYSGSASLDGAGTTTYGGDPYGGTPYNGGGTGTSYAAGGNGYGGNGYGSAGGYGYGYGGNGYGSAGGYGNADAYGASGQNGAGYGASGQNGYGAGGYGANGYGAAPYGANGYDTNGSGGASPYSANGYGGASQHGDDSGYTGQADAERGRGRHGGGTGH